METKTYTQEEFSDLVTRELRNKATEEEIAYLGSSEEILDRWIGALKMKKISAEQGIIAQKADILAVKQKYLAMGTYEAKNAWFTYKTEQEAKTVKISAFIGYVQQKLIQLKPIKNSFRDKNRVRSSSDVQRDFAQVRRNGYCEGFFDAIEHMLNLSKRNNARQSYDTCRMYWQTQLVPWKKSNSYSEKSPPFTYPQIVEDITGLDQ